MALINHTPELLAWKFGSARMIVIEQVAGDTHLSQATVLRWTKEAHIDLLEAFVIEAWCRYLGVSVGQLLEYRPDDLLIT